MHDCYSSSSETLRLFEQQAGRRSRELLRPPPLPAGHEMDMDVAVDPCRGIMARALELIRRTRSRAMLKLPVSNANSLPLMAARAILFVFLSGGGLS